MSGFQVGRDEGLKSCECIEQFQKHGIELPTKTMMDADMTKMYPGFVYPAKKNGKKHDCIISFCPFCGRKLHEVTEETWAERIRIAKEVQG